MKIRYLKLKNWLLAAIGGLLGFSMNSCHPTEYGCPCFDFQVKGTVMNATGEPITGIGVGRYECEEEIDGNVMTLPEIGYYDTTDADGRFDVHFGNRWPESQTIKVDFWDIDGEQNGRYRHMDVNVRFNDPEFQNYTATREIEVTMQQE